ncbi:MAG: RluA family pseudouridine synthase [Deltaproteobacteria bacterium]|nr:RluA family pseudouridine synthase [Deltaproteobacteria bacterium]
MRTRIITTIVSTLQGGEPLAGYCARRFTYFTQNEWEKEILSGKVSLNGERACNPAIELKKGDVLAYDGSAIVEPAVDPAIELLYEDKWFLAVHKTGNLPVHPAGRYFNHTLVFLLEDRCGRKLYPVHRLDRETSGVMLLAFDSQAVAALAQAVAQGEKEYLALVHGNFPDRELIVDLPLGRDDASAVRKKRRAWEGGTEAARTRFQKVFAAGDLSLVRCFPETGRLHQIRAHLLAAGFPIVGDKLYGRDETAFLTFVKQGFTPELAKRLILPRAALHSARIAFSHPWTKAALTIRAPLPPLFYSIGDREIPGLSDVDRAAFSAALKACDAPVP